MTSQPLQIGRSTIRRPVINNQREPLLRNSLALLSMLLFGTAVRAEEDVRIAPPSNGVELAEIDIVRRTALGAAKRADLTNMRLSLWFSGKWQTERDSLPPLITLESLNPIEDDTGKLLSTEARLGEIAYLLGEVRGTSWQTGYGKQGPNIRLLLDAPGRGASKIKAVKGKAKVALTKQLDLMFDDLQAISGKELDHPDMKDLKSMKLKFSIEEKDGSVIARLSAPVNYASPWNQGRVHYWTIEEEGNALSVTSERVHGEKGKGVTKEETYSRRTVKGLALHLRVLEPVESKTFEFDFQNVELP